MPTDSYQNYISLLSPLKSPHPLLITDIAPESRIVVAAPHHAVKGIPKMLCNRNADENAGCLALYLAQILKCSYIIANRYFIDPNKENHTDYFRFIEFLNPKLVIEIHGHGNRKAAFDIEVSSGPLDQQFARDFATHLAPLIDNSPELKYLSLSGDYQNIYYTAQYSLTITDDRWHSLHIELPPDIRKSPASQEPPQKGFLLMDKIAQIVRKL
jgi:hypothetical protein